MSGVTWDVADLLTIVATAITIPLLLLSVRAARRPAPVRTRLDLARLVVSATAIVLMALITRVSTASWLVAAGVVAGLGLGYEQGRRAQPDVVAGRLVVRASAVSLAAWGAGVVVMQVAGLLSRIGAIHLGQTMSWFGVGLAGGLLVGRARLLQQPGLAGMAGMAHAASAVILVACALPVGVTATTLAQRGGAAPAPSTEVVLTDDEICDLIPPIESQPGTYYQEGVYTPGFEGSGQAGCQYLVEPRPDQNLRVNVSLFDSAAAAQDQMAVLASNNAEAGAGAPQSLDLGDSADTWAWRPSWDPELPLYATNVLVGPFVVRVDGNNIETIPAARTVTNELTELVGQDSAAPAPAPPGDEAAQPESQAPDDAATSDTSQVPEVGVAPVADEAIVPEQAAGQAVAGLAAAAGIGLISWVQAAGAGRARRRRPGTGGRRRPEPGGPEAGGPEPGGPEPGGPEPTEPFIDPYDGTALTVDTVSGRVFWPWDGSGGHWVAPDQVPGLIEEWDRELEAENARRIEHHDAQREQNWADLRDRIRRTQESDDAHRAAQQARLADFDRRIAAARTWMEDADAGSLGQLDRITQRVADQGFVTDDDLDTAERIADRARVWVAEKAAWDAEDWARIEGNRAAVIEIAAKGAAITIDPTKGLASGFIFGSTESWHRGDDMATVIGNGLLDATVQRAGHAVSAWSRGQAALGKLGWGALSSSATAAGETIVRGGTAEEAWSAAQTGFVVGGLGGMVDEAVNAPAAPAADVPTIRVRSGGPKVGYDQPRSPRYVGPGDPRHATRVPPASDAPGGSDWSGPRPALQPDLGPEPALQPDLGPEPALQPDPQPMARQVTEPTPADLLADARPTRPSAEILDEMMARPTHPSGVGPSGGSAGAPDWQRGFFPDAHGRTMIDGDGRVVVGDRQVGSLDPATGTVRNLAGEPIRVAVDGRGIPVGYVEQPVVPEGMHPVYNGRGELAGYVDQLGRADIDGQRVPVAIDAGGSLVPHEPPAPAGPPAEYLPPEGQRSRTRIPGDEAAPPTRVGASPSGTRGGPGAGATDLPPPTGHVEAPPAAAPAEFTPYGHPVLPGDGQPPGRLADLDTAPRVPVLDKDGAVAHLVEPGPREIHFDGAGNPVFVQRQYPVHAGTIRDLVIDPTEAPAQLRRLPTPEVWDMTEARVPLTGEGAPPTAPHLPPNPPPNPSGGAA